MSECWSCGREGASMQCGACHTAIYCDRSCQKKDWSKHKLRCEEIKLQKVNGDGDGDVGANPPEDKPSATEVTDDSDKNKEGKSARRGGKKAPKKAAKAAHRSCGLRFPVGTRVECFMGREGWMPGIVCKHHYVEEGWDRPSSFVAPYQIELENGRGFIYASQDSDETIRQAPPHKKRGVEEKFCGLCGSRQGPFMLTECCGRRLCDTEGQYVMMSYDRQGQCARNHRYNTICGYHHTEGHGGDWKTCKKCEADFHPYDYAVKATSMRASGTELRYNFDDNVRTDLFPLRMAKPTCGECGVTVDTTEETTRTLSMRRLAGQKQALCEKHGGGFGNIKPPSDGCKQS